MFSFFKRVYHGPGKRTILNPRWARNRCPKHNSPRNKGYKPGIVKGFRDA